MTLKPIERSFFNRYTIQVAKDLLGKYLVRKIDNHTLVGMISEVEAYICTDPASHCFIGETERNKSLFGPVGHAYVYFSYGIHFGMNVVARDTKHSVAGGCLLRSVIPIEGIDIMEKNRGRTTHLTDGPGKLTQAFRIDKSFDGVDLCNRKLDLFIAYGKDIDKKNIIAAPRVGISKAKENLWRFYIKHNYFG